MQTVELTGKKREVDTRGALSALRQGGDIPAVVYGGKNPPLTASVNAKQLALILKGHGANVILNLQVEGATETVLLKTLQRDILSRAIIHIDFQRISLTEKIEVSVPIHVKGESPGVKLEGGILEHVTRELRVRCLPTAIPSALEADVSALQLNQGLRVKDIPVPADVEVLSDKEQIVINVVAPMEFEETPVPGAAVAAGTGPAEPEVIAKGKKPEEGAEGAAAPAAGAKDAAKPGAKDAAKPAGKEGK
jgi:large subunit ribosomal protein L25